MHDVAVTVWEGRVFDVQLPVMPKAHAVAELMREGEGVGDAECVRRFGCRRQPGHLAGYSGDASYLNAGTRQIASVLHHHVGSVAVAQRMGFVHVAAFGIEEMVVEAEHVDVLLRLRVFHFHGGHQVDALQRPAGTVGRIGERDVPIDHGAHGAMPALGPAGYGRIDDKHIDHAAVVLRRCVA